MTAVLPLAPVYHVIGKGPSLDRWVGEVYHAPASIAINEAGCVAGAPFALCTDPPALGFLQSHLPDRVRLLTTADRQRYWPRESIQFDRASVGSIQGEPTAATALRILAAGGVRDIVMVGFDALDDPTATGYAECLQAIYVPARHVGDGDYAAINREIVRIAMSLGLRLIWFHRTGRRTMTNRAWGQ